MKRLTLTFFPLVLLALNVPVYAQTATPPAPTGSAQAIVSDVIEATQTLGILTVVVLVALGILACIVVIVLVLAWKGLSPLLGTIRSLNTAREDLQEQLFKRLEAGDKERARTAEINERTVNTLTTLETKAEAQDGRKSAVQAIIEHTDGALKPIAEQIDSVIQLLTTDRREHAERANGLDGRVDKLDGKVDEAIRELRQLKTAILKGDTDKLPPLPEGFTDPAPPAPNAAADVWQGDHPAEKHEGD